MFWSSGDWAIVVFLKRKYFLLYNSTIAQSPDDQNIHIPYGKRVIVGVIVGVIVACLITPQLPNGPLAKTYIFLMRTGSCEHFYYLCAIARCTRTYVPKPSNLHNCCTQMDQVCQPRTILTERKSRSRG